MVIYRKENQELVKNMLKKEVEDDLWVVSHLYKVFVFVKTEGEAQDDISRNWAKMRKVMEDKKRDKITFH